MKMTRIITIVALLTVLAACVYRQDIPQGNSLNEEDIEAVEVGMNRSQVRYLLGTPMLETPLHEDRWLYHYYLDSQRPESESNRYLTIQFNEQGQVSEISTDGPGDEQA
jgi:outer membrane protein assembly factor BamE